MRGVIDFAESLSCNVCEDCGAMDETVSRNSRGWIRTTCEKCTPKAQLAEHKRNRNAERVAALQKARLRSKTRNKESESLYEQAKEESFVAAMSVSLKTPFKKRK
jgi:hypothetical protein